MDRSNKKNEITTSDCVISPARLKNGHTGAIKKTKGKEQEFLDQRKFDIDGTSHELEDLTFPQLLRKLATEKGIRRPVHNIVYNVRKHVKRVLKIPDKAASFMAVYILGTYTYDQYEYLSYLRALRSLVTCCQQENESDKAISDRIVPLYQKFKLVGGNLTTPGLIKHEQNADENITKKDTTT